jgi:predicted nuclease of predicted toxin-antitoxin system
VRFVVDESTGAAVVEYLRTAGHDVLAVAEMLPQADDADILARALTEGRILITNDKDFGDLTFRDGQPHSGVLPYLRVARRALRPRAGEPVLRPGKVVAQRR